MAKETPTPESGNPIRTEIPVRSKISNGTIINVVLFVGLIILYTLHFLPDRKQDVTTDIESEVSVISDQLAEGAFNIAFVNSDTLMANYTLALNMRDELEREQRRLENDLQRRQRTFQTELETFQRQIQMGALSSDNIQVKEQELMQMQQELMQLNESYANRLMAKEMEMNIELYQKITDLLSRFNREMGYDYILGFSPGGGILYAREKHDITRKILEKLNEEYDAQQ